MPFSKTINKRELLKHNKDTAYLKEKLRYAYVIILVLVLAACNLAVEETPFPANLSQEVTITPTITNTAEQENTSIPPLPTPTPTVEPNILLQVADSQLLNGYFENAVTTYQSIIMQSEFAPENIRSTAYFRMGQAALKEGFFGESAQAMTAFVTEFPHDARVAQAYFLRGDAYLGLGEWQSAINDFQQYIALRPGLIDSYAYERIGDAQLALGQTENALLSYDSALTTNRTLVPQLALREKVAQIYISIGRIADAIAQYDAILAVAQNGPYRAQIDYEAAKALINSGDTANGIPRMRRIFREYASTPSAYLAMQTLLANNEDIDDFTIGKVSYNYGDYQGAISAFNAYSTQYELTAIPAELHLLLGRAYREIGNPQAAIVAFQTIIAQHPQDPLFGDALLEQGRTRFLSGDVNGAIETYLGIAQNYSYLAETSAEALWRVGYLYGTNDNPIESRNTFVHLADTFPNSEWSRSGLFIAASAATRDQEWTVAENLYSRLAVITTGEDQSAAYLWVGRLALQRGDNSKAQQALALATQAAPDSYYAARAQDILIGRSAFQPPTNVQFEFDTAFELAEAENWLRQTFNISEAGDLWPLSADLESDSRMIRARELWIVGAYRESSEEFTSLLDESRANRNALRSYQLAIFLRSLGDYRQSIVAAADVIQIAGTSTLQAPRYIARMRYPIYYLDLVQAQAQQYGIDPLLMFSLIRQESLFNPNAISVADAHGLMQVIPSTGQYIANQLGWENYHPSDTLRPYAAIAFGTYYLDEQLRLFDGNVAAALAAYNGGPGNALDWYRLAGDDADAFVTAITFDETRTYVQRIYSHYNIYRALYGIG